MGVGKEGHGFWVDTMLFNLGHWLHWIPASFFRGASRWAKRVAVLV